MQKTQVLIVDDSLFFRKRLNEILSADLQIEVVGMAKNGKEAVELSQELRPDVITMDIEMPIMDGISAVREILKKQSVPILMLSSFTTEGAKATLDALDVGAVDYIPKRFKESPDDHGQAGRQLCARIRNLGSRSIRAIPAEEHKKYSNIPDAYTANKRVYGNDVDVNNYSIILIGASTGGPPVVQEIIKNLSPNHRVPVVIVQHMPESFTGPFAERLNDASKVNVVLAKDAEKLTNGYVYIAPGGHQLTFSSGWSNSITFSIKRSSPEFTYKPCIDVTFKSAAEKVDGKILAVVLTGMGSDGMEGARELKQKDSTIVVQDMESSVVYGMPMMVAKAGLADIQLSSGNIAKLLAGKH